MIEPYKWQTAYLTKLNKMTSLELLKEISKYTILNEQETQHDHWEYQQALEKLQDLLNEGETFKKHVGLAIDSYDQDGNRLTSILILGDPLKLTGYEPRTVTVLISEGDNE